jgi:hypothetical protein
LDRQPERNRRQGVKFYDGEAIPKEPPAGSFTRNKMSCYGGDPSRTTGEKVDAPEAESSGHLFMRRAAEVVSGDLISEAMGIIDRLLRYN